MDPIEQIFRKRPRDPIALRNYVLMLFEKQHILEAKHYFDLLIKEDPLGFKTNRLGYLIAIRMINPNVADYEKRLVAAGATKEQAYALQLHNYFTFSVLDKMRQCADALLDIEPTEKFTYDVILESIVRLEDIDLVVKVARYLLPRITPTDQLLKKLHSITNKRLIGLIKTRGRK